MNSDSYGTDAMIRCLPTGICSWNFSLEGAGHHADLEFRSFSDQGMLTMDGITFDVNKPSPFSGHWTLDRGGSSIASARKTSALTRTIEIQTASHDLVTLRPESSLGRSFRVERSGVVISRISPDHPFTRRATIESFPEGLDFPTVCFLFWLVALMWRRNAQAAA